MRRNLTGISWLLFGLSVIFFIALTIFESALAGTSLTAQRVIILLCLVLPASVGAVLGVMGLSRKQGRAWLAITAALLNALFAIFHLMIILFAG